MQCVKILTLENILADTHPSFKFDPKKKYTFKLGSGCGGGVGGGVCRNGGRAATKRDLGGAEQRTDRYVH